MKNEKIKKKKREFGKEKQSGMLQKFLKKKERNKRV